MLGYLKERLFPLLIAFSALSVSVSAAFYSVSGLSKLFAGAAFAVIVMAASLEIAKLAAESMTTGDPKLPSTDIGPLVSETQFNKVQDLLKSGVPCQLFQD